MSSLLIILSVWAQMLLKSPVPADGFTRVFSEGKVRYICPVDSMTFAEGEDSYHAMHHHGVAFENPWMAYRIYFDKKQTIDVYAKRRPGMEIQRCLWYPNDTLLAEGFGDDILRVSGWMGVGSCKPWNGKKMIHFDDCLSRSQRIVELSRQKAVVEVTSHGWKPQGDTVRYDITTRYTIYSNRRDAMAEVFTDAPYPLCTGVQHVGEPCYLSEDGLVASWGTAFPVNDTVKYGKETCGLAVYVPEAYRGEAVRDAHNNMQLLRLHSGYARYYLTVVSLKENRPPATSAPAFWRYARRWVQKLKK